MVGWGRSVAQDPNERHFSITLNMSGFSGMSIPWEGTSAEDARGSFMEYLFNPEFADDDRYPKWRTLTGSFNGLSQAITFRTDWVSGFAISPSR